MRRRLVPLAEQVNDVAVRGASAADVAATRRTLLVVETARDETQAWEVAAHAIDPRRAASRQRPRSRGRGATASHRGL